MASPARNGTLSSLNLHKAQKLRDFALAHQAEVEAATLRRRRARRVWAAALLLSAGAVGGIFQSCASQKDRAGDDGALAANSGAESKLTMKSRPAVGKDSDRRAAGVSGHAAANNQFDQAAVDLQAMFDRLNRGEEVENTKVSTLGEKNGDPAKIRPAANKVRPVSEPGDAPAQDEPKVKPSANKARHEDAVPPITTAQHRAQLATELAALLRPEVGEGTNSFRAIAPLLAVETLEPGSAQPEIEQAMRAMNLDERAAVSTVRDLLRQIGNDPKLLSDPDALGRRLSEYAAKLNVNGTAGGEFGEGLSLGTVALCTRVESFGRYAAYPSTRFIAGRANAAILYVEVGNFKQLPTGMVSTDGTGDGYSVELTQQARLFDDKDGSLQWKYAAATIRDSSRTRRRDFFVVQRIELPSNLSIGQYTLKVTVRDVAGGEEAEATVPIQIVADPTAGSGPKVKSPAKETEDDSVKPGKERPVQARKPEDPDAQRTLGSHR